MKDYTYNRNCNPDFSRKQGQPDVPKFRKAVISEQQLGVLREAIRAYYTEKRYAHALAVEREAVRFGEIFLPERVNALGAAALLHDITKKYDLEKQLKCCADFGIIIKPPFSPEVLHAVTGALVAEKDFPQYTDSEILAGIRFHTTGRWGMTVFEAIVFLADYIEVTRTHPTCVCVRNELYARLDHANTLSEKEKALNSAVLSAFDNTVTYLLSKRTFIETDTVEARNYYLAEKEL